MNASPYDPSKTDSLLTVLSEVKEECLTSFPRLDGMSEEVFQKSIMAFKKLPLSSGKENLSALLHIWLRLSNVVLVLLPIGASVLLPDFVRDRAWEDIENMLKLWTQRRELSNYLDAEEWRATVSAIEEKLDGLITKAVGSISLHFGRSQADIRAELANAESDFLERVNRRVTAKQESASSTLTDGMLPINKLMSGLSMSGSRFGDVLGHIMSYNKLDAVQLHFH